jgi:predicted HAD superfamily hydrolase
MIKVWSFDIFDTCLIRECAFPTDAFGELAKELRPQLEPALGLDFVEHFVAARIEAENRARKNEKEEITLEEIWEELVSIIKVLDVASGVQKELMIEESLIYPNNRMLEQCQNLRSRDENIIFISDTYFSKAFVRKLLIKYDFAQSDNVIYVSSEHRLQKHSGNLYKYVLAKEGINASQLSHRGDNIHSDVNVPLALGIDAVQDTSCSLNSIEKGLLAGQFADYGTISKLIGGMRKFKLAGSTSLDFNHRDYVASFLGPFILSFGSWVLGKAQQDGVQRLYFFSRDCYLLCEAAKKLAPNFGDIECRYLHISRQSVFFPTITNLSYDAMPWFFRSFEKPILKNLLAKLELDFSQIKEHVKFFSSPNGQDTVLDNDIDRAYFWNLVNQEPYYSYILNRVAIRRTAAQKYFHEQGLLDDVHWAVVDIGWYLTCQKHLRELLRTLKPGIDIQGYYIGLFIDRLSSDEAGKSCALYYMSPPDRRPYVNDSKVFGRATLLEHFLGCAPHGTVHHYEISNEDYSIPVCGGCTNDQILFSEQTLELILDFVQSNVEISKKLAEQQNSYYLLDTLTNKFCSNPNSNWANLISRVKASSDQNNIDSSEIAVPIKYYNLILMFLPKRVQKLIFRKNVKNEWPEGDRAISVQNVIVILKICDEIKRIYNKIRLLLR